MNALDAARPIGVGARARCERRSLIASLGRVLLLATVPLCLVWLPIGNIPSAGNVTVNDLALISLWIITMWVLATGGLARMPLEPLAILLLALEIGLLAAIGSELNLSKGKGMFEFSLTLKRFGLAAILPVAAVLFGTREMAGRMRWVTLFAVAALALFALCPSLQTHLVRPPEWWERDTGERATGLVTNPNDLAYTAVALALMNGAFYPWHRPRWWDRLLLGIALCSAGACLILAASRSGLLGGAAALVVVMASRYVRFQLKAACVVAAIFLITVGLTTSDAFSQRVTRAYEQGRQEENVSSRLDAQWLALSASLKYPLGVGFTGYDEATNGMTGRFRPLGADSVYFDTLLGAGVLGLSALLTLFVLAWRYVTRVASSGGLSKLILHAGIVAFLVFGTASIIPMAVTVAPLFFSLIAAAAYSNVGASAPPGPSPAPDRAGSMRR